MNSLHTLRSLLTLRFSYLWLLIALGLTTGCGLGAYTTQVTETSGVTTPPGPLRVTVTNFDGPITVTTGPDSRVEATLVRGSRTDDPTAAQAETDAIEMAINQSGADVAISVDYTGQSPHQAEATLTVTVPDGSTLDLRSATGEIDARGAFGDVTAQLDSGGIIFGAFEEESFGVTINAQSGELQSDFETLSSRPLTGFYEGQVGEAPTRRFTATLGSGKVLLRQMSAP